MSSDMPDSTPRAVITKKNGAILWETTDRRLNGSCLVLCRKPKLSFTGTYQPAFGQNFFVTKFPFFRPGTNDIDDSGASRGVIDGSSAIYYGGYSDSYLGFLNTYESSDKLLLYHKLLKFPKPETVSIPTLTWNEKWTPENSRNELPKDKDETEGEYKKRIRDNSGKDELLTLGFEAEERPVFYCDCTEEWDLTAKNFDMSGDGTKENPWKNFMVAMLSIQSLLIKAFGYTNAMYQKTPKICIKIKGTAVIFPDKRILDCVRKFLYVNTSTGYAFSNNWNANFHLGNAFFTSLGNESFTLKIIDSGRLSFQGCIFDNANILIGSSSQIVNAVLFYKCTINALDRFYNWLPNMFYGLPGEKSTSFCDSELHLSNSFSNSGFFYFKNCNVIFPDVDLNANPTDAPVLEGQIMDNVTITTPSKKQYGVYITSYIVNNLITQTSDQTMILIQCKIIANFSYSSVLKEFLPWSHTFNRSYNLGGQFVGWDSYRTWAHGITCEEMYNVKANVSGAPFSDYVYFGSSWTWGYMVQQFRIDCRGTIEKCEFHCDCNETLKNVPTTKANYPWVATSGGSPTLNNSYLWYYLSKVYLSFYVGGSTIVDSTIELSSAFDIGGIKYIGDNCCEEYSDLCATCFDQYITPGISVGSRVSFSNIINTKITNNVSSSSNGCSTIEAAVVVNSSLKINCSSDYWEAIGLIIGAHGSYKTPANATCNASVKNKGTPWCEVEGENYEYWHKQYFKKDHWMFEVYAKNGSSWTVPDASEHCKSLRGY